MIIERYSWLAGSSGRFENSSENEDMKISLWCIYFIVSLSDFSREYIRKTRISTIARSRYPQITAKVLFGTLTPELIKVRVLSWQKE